MSSLTLARRHARRLTAAAALLALYGMARLPSPAAAERHRLASRFAFSRREPLAGVLGEHCVVVFERLGR